METTLIVFTSLYCLAVLAVFRVFLKSPAMSKSENEPFISVIISARNEEKRIINTLESLSRINYPLEKYEIIFIDDGSVDGTAKEIQSYVDKNVNWFLISTRRESTFLSGKKNALKKGIDASRGEIILTTDADCIVPESWLSEMAGQFTKNTVMVLGHALLLKKKGWFDKLLRFDNLFSGIMTAAPAQMGFPISSVGRNMAYRKEAYDFSGGYKDLAKYKSGDDVHLTELFRRKVTGKITFNFRKESYTTTKTPDSYKELFYQQIRKNSKLLQKSLASISISVFLLVYHILLIGDPLMGFVSLKMWFSLLGIKLAVEFITLVAASIKLADPRIIPYIPIMQIIYPVYVSVMAITGTLQKFEWKN